jgi:hypothetical protein
MIVTNVLIIVENVIIDESELDYHLQRQTLRQINKITINNLTRIPA